MSFFVNQRPQSANAPNATDVVADHYFDNGWPRRSNIGTNPLLLWDSHSKAHNDRAKSNVNQHLSHIATTRVSERGKFNWPDVDRTLVLTCYLGFIRDLKAAHPHRVRWFSEATRIVRERLKNPDPVANPGATPTQLAVLPTV